MFSSEIAAPWSVLSIFSATPHLAMTEPPSLTGPALSAYLGEVRSLNCGDKPDIASARSATIFSPFALLFGFRPSASLESDFRSSANIGVPGLGNEWTGSLIAFRGVDDSFFLRPGDIREKTFVANIGLALLAAGHTPNMPLAWDRVKEDALYRLYLTAEKEVGQARINGKANGRGSHGEERSRFDLLAMECEHCATAQAKRLESLCSLIVGPPQGPHPLGYSFEFPRNAQDPRWKGRADLCAQLLAVGAAILIDLDHNYPALNSSVPRDGATAITTKQFGDVWLIGLQILFSTRRTPAGSEWEPPVIRVGDEVLPLVLHQFGRVGGITGDHAARFAAVHRLDLRPGDHKLNLAVSWPGNDMRQEYTYRVPKT